MKGPYENNKVYAVAASRKGLRTGYVSAVFAQVRQEYSGRASGDSNEGKFFLVKPEEQGGTADKWDPDVAEGSLLALPEDEDPLDLLPSHVLSTWSDREEAWAAYEARRAAGRKGAAGRREREAQEKEEAAAAELKARRAKQAATPLGRLKKSTRGLENAFRIPAHDDRPEMVHVTLVLTQNNFRKLMAFRGADADLVEEFLASEDDFLFAEGN